MLKMFANGIYSYRKANILSFFFVINNFDKIATDNLFVFFTSHELTRTIESKTIKKKKTTIYTFSVSIVFQQNKIEIFISQKRYFSSIIAETFL